MAILEITEYKASTQALLDGVKLDLNEQIALDNQWDWQKAYKQYKIAENFDEYFRALILCNRGNRAELLEDILYTKNYRRNDIFTQSQINEMIRYVWCDSENNYQMREHWDSIWDLYDDPVNTKLVNRLFKQPREVYRGSEFDGYSWTLKEDVAKFFCSRRSENTRLMKRTVTADDVIAVFNDRNEQEVVLYQ